MGKSLRSKVKRQFRAKKRTEGVYAATEAARLHRLHMKLKSLTTTEPEDGDEEVVEEGEEGAQMETDGGAAPAGWSPSPFWFASLGLVDPHDITADSMAGMMHLAALGDTGTSSGFSRQRRRNVTGKNRIGRNVGRTKAAAAIVAAADAGSACGLDHLFPGLPLGPGAGIEG